MKNIKTFKLFELQDLSKASIIVATGLDNKEREHLRGLGCEVVIRGPGVYITCSNTGIEDKACNYMDALGPPVEYESHSVSSNDHNYEVRRSKK